MRWLESTTNSTDMSLSKLREIVEGRGAWHATVHGVAKSQTGLSDLTTIKHKLTRAKRTGKSMTGTESTKFLKLKLQYFVPLMRRTDSFEKTFMLGQIEGRRRGQQRMRWLDGITYSMDISLS